MSKDGRAQDAVYEILGGYDDSMTTYHEGPMYGHPELSKTVQMIVDALRNIYYEA